MKRKRLLAFLLTGALAAGMVLPYLPGAAQGMSKVFAAEDTREWTNNPGIGEPGAGTLDLLQV